MRIVLALGVCALLLAGCGPGMWEPSSEAGQQPTSTAYQQPAAPGDQLPDVTLPDQPAATQNQGLAAKDDAICRSYGVYPGTTPYVQCRLGLRRQESEGRQNDSPLQRLFD